MRGIFQMSGLEELIANIQKAGNDIDAVAAEAVDAGGDIMFGAVKSSAAPFRDTGEMENEISRTETKRDGNYTFVEVAVDPSDKVDHELHVEYGTSDTPARGFFRRGIDQARSKVRAKWREVFKARGFAE